MLIRLKKTRDGVVLTCIRDSGPVAVQRTGHAGFFALHDLMHYAVETTLGWKQAFFGLMAAGWDFSTFENKDDPRYRQAPEDALIAEHLVNVLSLRGQAAARRDPELRPLWADEINADMRLCLAKDGLSWTDLTAETLSSILDRFESLADRWAALPVGEHLELFFPSDH